MTGLEKALKYFLIIILVAFVTFVATSLSVMKIVTEKQENQLPEFSYKEDTTLVKLKSLYETINKVFYKPTDEKKLEEGAMRGLMTGLEDPYSYYMSEEELKSFNETTTGEYVGIGLYLKADIETNAIEVIGPVKGSPAEEAGIQAGDCIIGVDNAPYTASEMQTAIGKMKGEKGTTVNIILLRNGERIEKSIVRREIDINQISYEVLDGNIGYIEVSLFDENVSKDFRDAYEDLMKKKVKGIIVDLRDNPGGILSEVLDMCDMLLPEGIIVYTVDNQGERTDYTSDKECYTLPLVVLVNRNSASASEIFASAIQDHGVGTIVGMITYGKGLVQRMYTFGDKDGMKITVAEYFSPNGNKINGKGVMPDVFMFPDSDDTVDEELERAKEILNK